MITLSFKFPVFRFHPVDVIELHCGSESSRALTGFNRIVYANVQLCNKTTGVSAGGWGDLLMDMKLGCNV